MNKYTNLFDSYNVDYITALEFKRLLNIEDPGSCSLFSEQYQVFYYPLYSKKTDEEFTACRILFACLLAELSDEDIEMYRKEWEKRVI